MDTGVGVGVGVGVVEEDELQPTLTVVAARKMLKIKISKRPFFNLSPP
jgi:hypothetical protein